MEENHTPIPTPVGQCGVCFKELASCVCPTCDECEQVGQSLCYREHGLKLNREQLMSRAHVIYNEKLFEANQALKRVSFIHKMEADYQETLTEAIRKEQK